MANENQLELLRQGVFKWNDWRYELKKKDYRTYVGMRPDLTNANLSGWVLRGADLNGADFTGADLTGANLIEAELSGTDFTGANLTNADLNSSYIAYAYFNAADLSRADLGFATIINCEFINADLTGTEMGYTRLIEIDLSTVNGLETIQHRFESSIGIDTIYKSKGRIPEVFLQGVGVPDTFISYAASLTAKAFDFYTCFISFTEADDCFANRLYNDLKVAGVRCWRWKEDAKWGRTLLRSIDEAVRVYDKLVVVCSEQSLQSPAVTKEIERALQKEDDLVRQGKDPEVLFPIRLDDYIFTGWNHYRKADVLAKNVGDFREWTNPETYNKNFERLVRDLAAEEETQQ